MIITKYVIHRGKKKLVSDLSPSSAHKIEVECPECHEIRLTLLRVIKRRNNHKCHRCTLKEKRKPISRKSRFGKLVVLGASDRSGHSICQCDCGNISESNNYSLRIGETNSCGCLRHNNKFHYQLKGKDHPNWKGGISDQRERLMQTKVYKVWREAVFMRDNYTCQICGQIGGNLVVHHLESYNSNPKLRTTLSNGATVCEEHHIDFHHVYGYGKNTEKQFNEFKFQSGAKKQH